MRATFFVAAFLTITGAAVGDTAPSPARATPTTLKGPFELHSRVYPGTVRRYWVYVPADYDPARPPNLLLFQDGQRAVNPNGSLRIPAVLDDLVRRRAIPPTLGVFVTPGHRASHYPDDLGWAIRTTVPKNMTRFRTIIHA